MAVVVSATATALAAADNRKPRPTKRCPPYGTGISQRDALAGYLDAIWIRRDLNAFYTFVYPDIILHDLYAGGGRAASIAAFESTGQKKSIITFQNAFPPGGGTSHGVLHYNLTTPPDAMFFPNQVFTGMETYRFDGPCIAETWLVYRNPADNATSSHPVRSISAS